MLTLISDYTPEEDGCAACQRKQTTAQPEEVSFDGFVELT